MVNILFSILFFLFVFISCSSQHSLSSVDFDACFMNYTDETELTETLGEVNKTVDSEMPSTSVMAVIGCLNYQLGNYSVSEQWLIRAFNESEYKGTKSLAASALGLIYLKELQKDKIQPYMASAEEHYLGKWMLVLYHLENYRLSGHTEYLLSAIEQLEKKHQKEGSTSATERLLAHMKLINQMEEKCGNDPEDSSCEMDNLNDEKHYLFSTAYGFLSMLLKEPPLNNIQF